jgi:PII-like signaling protein
MVTMERASVALCRHEAAETLRPLRVSAEIENLSTLPGMKASERMTINEDGVLLRVFIGESDRWEHRPLYEALLGKVRELGLAGATVLRGIEGFGAHSVVHKARLLEMSADLPIVVEIVDRKEKVEVLLPHLEAMVKEGMVTMEYVRVLVYRSGK